MQVRHFCRLRKTLKHKNCQNFEKTAFDVSVFHYVFQLGCVYIFSCGLNSWTIHEMYDYD